MNKHTNSLEEPKPAVPEATDLIRFSPCVNSESMQQGLLETLTSEQQAESPQTSTLDNFCTKKCVLGEVVKPWCACELLRLDGSDEGAADGNRFWFVASHQGFSGTCAHPPRVDTDVDEVLMTG